MCSSRHHRADPDGAEIAAAPEPLDVRASDAERERTVDELRAHAGAGRLDAGELEERLGRALAATRRAELAALVADLPAERSPRAPAPVRRHGQDPLALLPIAVLLVAIWALSGAGYFWPAWPLLWFAFAGLGHRWRPRHAGNIGVIR